MDVSGGFSFDRRCVERFSMEDRRDTINVPSTNEIIRVFFRVTVLHRGNKVIANVENYARQPYGMRDARVTHIESLRSLSFYQIYMQRYSPQLTPISSL